MCLASIDSSPGPPRGSGERYRDCQRVPLPSRKLDAAHQRHRCEVPRPFGGSAAEWIGRPLSRLPIGGAPLSRITCTAFGVHPLACHQSHSSLATLAADEPGLIERRHIVVCASLQPEGTVAFARPFPSRPVQAVPNEHRHGRSLHILRFARKHVGSWILWELPPGHGPLRLPYLGLWETGRWRSDSSSSSRPRQKLWRRRRRSCCSVSITPSYRVSSNWASIVDLAALRRRLRIIWSLARRRSS
jgi:hypothetical protein